MTMTAFLNRIVRNTILPLFLSLPFLAAAQADLKINELMAKNVSYLMDKSYITQTYKKVDNGIVMQTLENISNTWVQSGVWTDTRNYSMWVEVYNPTGSTKTLSNYYFTDDLSKPTKWKPLSVNGSVDGGKFVVLFFEREDEEAYTSYVRPASTSDLYLLNRKGHASFKLEPDGGKLYLFNSSKTLIDSVIYLQQYRNISYGRTTDGGDSWAFFEQPSPGSNNVGKTTGTQRCLKPVFTLDNGFYETAQSVGFVMPLTGETIYYTTDGSEPTLSSNRYTTDAVINLPAGITKLRAKTFSAGKLSSDVVTSTYFIGKSYFKNLPVVSIVTDDAYFYGKDYGLYYSPDNLGIGLPGRGQNGPKNTNQDWDRPVNFEFFDKNGQPRLNQEVDVSILGGWSRFFSSTQKSLAISPKDKFGIDQLNYDFFAGSKPGHQYKDIQLRNSGNDNGKSMMQDGFILSISANRMDVDYLAYEPCVLFINGTYIGIQNIRERSNADFLFSNYGYAKDDVEIIEAVGPTLETKNDMKTDPAFKQLIDFLKFNDLKNPEIYRQVCDSIDVDEFINYMIPQIYVANTDWPDNNVKMWRKKKGGKWRWLLYDTDFGFDNSKATFNALSFAFGENGSSQSATNQALPEWSYIVFKRLCTNPEFVNKLVNRFVIHMSTTYAPARVNRIMDSLANRIDEEYPSVRNYLSGWRNFAATRNMTVLNHITERFMKDPTNNMVPTFDVINIDANIDGASYKLNNDPVTDKQASIYYFKDRKFSLEANKVKGYKFDHWWYNYDSVLVSFKENWKYYYYTNMPLKDGVPSADWYKTDFDDNAWTVAKGTFGHRVFGKDTELIYSIKTSDGKKDSIRFITAYFRKKFTVTDLANKNGFRMNVNLYGGAVIYINGIEFTRINMSQDRIIPKGAITYNTLIDQTQTAFIFDGVATVDIPNSCLKEGENTIAVEVHKYYLNSLRFDLELSYQLNTTSNEPVNTATLHGTRTMKAYYVPYTEPEPAIEKNIVINEVVSSNLQVTDEFGEKEDYIELYNKGSEPIDIGGWYITDTPSNKLFHQMPTNNPSVTTIEPGGHLILWADDEANQGTLHLGLKLGKEGETLILSRMLEDNSVAVIDSVSFPVLGSLSYSRVPDGSLTWVIQGLTCGTSNSPNDILSPETSTIALYPTQVTESFTVKNAEGLMISVIDLTGKVLKREWSTSDESIIQTGDLSRGMYLVTVGKKTFKVIRR